MSATRVSMRSPAGDWLEVLPVFVLPACSRLPEGKMEWSNRRRKKNQGRFGSGRVKYAFITQPNPTLPRLFTPPRLLRRLLSHFVMLNAWNRLSSCKSTLDKQCVRYFLLRSFTLSWSRNTIEPPFATTPRKRSLLFATSFSNYQKFPSQITIKGSSRKRPPHISDHF